MTTTMTGTDMRIELAALAADFSRADGDGHRWDEDDTRQWLLRMGFVTAGGGGAGGYTDDTLRAGLGAFQKAG